ncbi:MAG: DUF5691 domain-containing protein [Stappiaceae bacterium]
MPSAETDMPLIDAARLRWMGGGGSQTGDDAFFAETSDGEGQLRLLALAAQLKPVCLRPRAPEDLQTQALFPEPSLPLLAEPLRPLFRRLIKQADTRQKSEGLITLMTRRGVMAHPFDWLPPSDPTGYPDAYMPISKWIAGVASPEKTPLTADTWDDLFPAERRLALEQLRHTDPTAGRSLLQEKFGTAPAEERLRLVETLTIRLSGDDQSLLENLHASDRSRKVKERARQLLARLGAVGTAEDAIELARYFETGKTGLLRRKSVIRVRKKLNSAQQRRAHELLQSVPALAFAEALELTVFELISSIEFTEEDWNQAFLATLAETATEQDLLAYWQRLRDRDEARFVHLEMLQDRLSRETILSEAHALVAAGSFALDACLKVVGPDAPSSFSIALLKAKTVREPIAQALEAHRGDAGAHSANAMQHTLRMALGGLGLILSREAAQLLLDDMTAGGLHLADPLLDPLKFNAALKKTAHEGASP